MSNWQAYLDQQKDRYLEDLTAFLRIPSISSLAEHKADVDQAADWVAERLRAAGLEEVRVMPTRGHPVVYGHWLRQPEKPTVMIYGHLDVQPVDPLELWTQPPFEPVIQGDRIFARGASDDKGNMLAPILAIEALMQDADRLPVNLKVFFEGQEEIGSPDLPEFVSKNRDLLSCDMIFSADGSQWGEDQPALVIGRRGLCALQIDVKGARGDLHSGTYGGAILNPIHALAGLIATMHHPDGRIAVNGFYDDVRVLSPEEKAHFEAVPYGEAELTSELGVPGVFGEPGYSTNERLWARPTLELNGIWGGFQGEGSKTVLPSEAHAKISCRLVPHQDPEKVLDLVLAHIRKHAPAQVTVSTRQSAGHADPVSVPLDHPGNQAAASVFKKLYEKAPYVVGMGGTIPVCGLFKKNLNVDVINFAFGLKDENIHAPDEFFRVSSFERAQKAWGLLLEALGK
jgi:acetylornithine deacetylase/succinyl-diaminopimelate desuccinylase-like protein